MSPSWELCVSCMYTTFRRSNYTAWNKKLEKQCFFPGSCKASFIAHLWSRLRQTWRVKDKHKHSTIFYPFSWVIFILALWKSETNAPHEKDARGKLTMKPILNREEESSYAMLLQVISLSSCPDPWKYSLFLFYDGLNSVRKLVKLFSLRPIPKMNVAGKWDTLWIN